MKECPKCGVAIEADGAPFCAACGFRMGEGAPETPRPQPSGKFGNRVAAADDLPVGLEINDNHFYMKGRAGVLDFLVHSRGARLPANVHLAVSGDLPGISGDRRLTLKVGMGSRQRIQITPTMAGEHLLHLTLRCSVGVEVYVLEGQAILKVLDEDVTPSSLHIVVDQRTQAEGGSKIGFGQSIQNDVSEGFAKGLIRSANDLLQRPFPDRWNEILLTRAVERPEGAHDIPRPPKKRRIEPDPFPGNLTGEDT